jgi:hypothetical protein
MHSPCQFSLALPAVHHLSCAHFDVPVTVLHHPPSLCDRGSLHGDKPCATLRTAGREHLFFPLPLS